MILKKGKHLSAVAFLDSEDQVYKPMGTSQTLEVLIYSLLIYLYNFMQEPWWHAVMYMEEF